MIEGTREIACDWIFVDLRLREVRAKSDRPFEEDPNPHAQGWREKPQADAWGWKAGGKSRLESRFAGTSAGPTSRRVGLVVSLFFLIPNCDRLRGYQ
jgi:hypothetical protein